MGGNICAKEVEPEENEETEDLEERGTKSVAQRRATKGKGLLGKTDWSDEEDEEDQTGEEATDKIMDLPEAEDTSNLGAVKEFESQKRICIYIGELNAQSSPLH